MVVRLEAGREQRVPARFRVTPAAAWSSRSSPRRLLGAAVIDRKAGDSSPSRPPTGRMIEILDAKPSASSQASRPAASPPSINPKRVPPLSGTASAAREEAPTPPRLVSGSCCSPAGASSCPPAPSDSARASTLKIHRRHNLVLARLRASHVPGAYRAYPREAAIFSSSIPGPPGRSSAVASSGHRVIPVQFMTVALLEAAIGTEKDRAPRRPRSPIGGK